MNGRGDRPRRHVEKEVKKMRRLRTLLAIAITIGLIAAFWRELPAIRRYIKIERM